MKQGNAVPNHPVPERNPQPRLRVPHLAYATDSGAPQEAARIPGPAGVESPDDATARRPPTGPQLVEGIARLDKRTKAHVKTPANHR
jgi:hypothetical protein